MPAQGNGSGSQGGFGNQDAANAMINMGSGLLQGYGQGQQNQASNAASLDQTLQQLMQQFYQGNQTSDIARGSLGLGATQMNPAAQAQGLSKALVQGNVLKNLRPSQINAPDFLSGYMPQMSGGAMGAIPEGGFDSSITNASSPTGILASANQFQRAQAVANPKAPGMDLGPAFGAAGTQATQDNNAFQQDQLKQFATDRNSQQQGLQNSLNQAQGDAYGGSNLASNIGGAAGAGMSTIGMLMMLGLL